MIGKNFVYNGQSISRQDVNFEIGITDCQWYKLDTTDQETNIQGFHGVKVSPTLARSRRIILEGLILADTRQGSSEGIDFLNNLFALKAVPSTVNLQSFTITDEQNRIWEIQAKVKEPLDIQIPDDDYLVGAVRKWRVVLQGPDPRYYNAIEQEDTGSEAYFGGVKIGTKLGVKLDENFNEIQVVSNGNIATPLKFTITALGDINAPLTIKDLTSGKFFALDVNAVAGDVIIVDSKTFTATKNGVNIIANRVSGSNWLNALGDTVFTVYDQDGGLVSSDFNVSITYRDALL